jgi:hypothetical protein
MLVMDGGDVSSSLRRFPMRWHSRSNMVVPHATRPPHYPLLPAPPAGIRHPLFVAFVALLIALFTLTPTAQAHDEGMGTLPAVGAWSIDAEPMGEPVGPWPLAPPDED